MKKKQRDHPNYNKDNAASPTMSNESVIIMGVIHSKEGRDVAILNIPGAFLYTKIKYYIVMLLQRILAELILKVALEIYSKYVQFDESGRPILYVQLCKAVYGWLKIELLFLKKLSEDLQKMGFKLNPYKIYVANKNIYGNEMAVVKHVDDIKISHKDQCKVTKLIKCLEDLYREVWVTWWRYTSI